MESCAALWALRRDAVSSRAGPAISHVAAPMSSFDLRRLRYFVAVAELGSVTSAARELYVAQPALSNHIKRLEDEVGGELFTRSPRGVQLTKLGEKLLGHARTILKEIEILRGDLRGAPSEPEGTVVIGMAPTIGTILASAVLESVAKRLPRVRVQIRESMSRDLPDLIRGGALDYALSYDIATERGVQSTPVFVEDSYLVGLWSKARTYKNLERKRDVPFDALQGIPLFLSGPANAFREKLEQTAVRRRVELHIVGEVDSLSIRRDLARRGVGFTILSGTAIHASPEEKDIFAARIVRPRILRQICFVRPSSAPTSRAAIEVAQIIDQTLRALLDESAWTGASPRRKSSLVSFA